MSLVDDTRPLAVRFIHFKFFLHRKRVYTCIRFRFVAFSLRFSRVGYYPALLFTSVIYTHPSSAWADVPANTDGDCHQGWPCLWSGSLQATCDRSPSTCSYPRKSCLLFRQVPPCGCWTPFVARNGLHWWGRGERHGRGFGSYSPCSTRSNWYPARMIPIFLTEDN